MRSTGTGTRPRRANKAVVVAPTTSALPGGRFGAFRFIERVERGGPAEMYRALWSDAPSAAERICSIKRLRPELASSPAFVRMFQDEARIMAQLSHPNVVRVFAHGELEGCPMAMEPLEGCHWRSCWPACARSARSCHWKWPVTSPARWRRRWPTPTGRPRRWVGRAITGAGPPRRPPGQRAAAAQRLGEVDRIRRGQGGQLRQPEPERHRGGHR